MSDTAFDRLEQRFLILDGPHKKVAGPQTQRGHHPAHLGAVAEHDGGNLQIELTQGAARLLPGNGFQIQLAQDDIEVLIVGEKMVGLEYIGEHFNPIPLADDCLRQRGGPSGIVIDEQHITFGFHHAALAERVLKDSTPLIWGEQPICTGFGQDFTVLVQTTASVMRR